MFANQSTQFNTPVASLPPQMIAKRKKSEDWRKINMDSLEMIGRNQHVINLKLIENYEMIKGQFIFRHYFDDAGYSDMVSQLTKEFELPSYLRHYDIISQVINTLSGEYQKRPDNFRVRGYDENTTNEYLRTKTDLLLNYVQDKINAEIDQRLIAKGLDPNKSDFNSPEEKQQYVQLVDQQRQTMTPPEIQTYMDTKWQNAAEIWGEHQLELDRQRYNLAEKEKKEFEDMLVADRCFRHFYLTGNGYEQETWNPINTFYHKSPDIDYIEDGDYVGRIFYFTIADIIDRYGHLMTKDDLESLQGDVDFTLSKDVDGYGIQYGSVIPYAGYPQHKVVTDTIGYNPMTSQGIPTLDSHFFANLNSDNFYLDTRGLIQVTEAYWKSQKKIGKVTYIDDETGLQLTKLVDEDFVVPQGFKEIDSKFYDTEEPGTIVWTWINEVWKGIKINFNQVQNVARDIYLEIKPLEFQFKGELNPYSAKLPVCGQLFSPRNSRSMSLVDLMKPHQIGYNVAINQLYQIMEREIGRFIIMDVNMFPAMKDWGGEKGWEKFMLVAKSLGMAPVDTSPQNTKGATGPQGGFLPRDVNLDESARMMSRAKIAEMFENMALKQIGFNSYRLGSFGTSATAGGVENGQQASYAQTETYFTNFSNYTRRCHQMNLDIAQYVQSQNQDITVTYTKSDISRAFTKLNGTELLMADLQVYVSNSQEQIRQLETLRQLAIENNTSGATIVDLANMITMNSPAEIKVQLQRSFQDQQARTDKQFELEQQKAQQEKELAEAQMAQEADEKQKDRDNKKEVAYIQSVGRTEGTQDINGDSAPDVLEYQKLSQKQNDSQTKSVQESQKIELARQKLIADKEYNVKSLQIEQEKIRASETNQDKKLQMTKILKGNEKAPPKRK